MMRSDMIEITCTILEIRDKSIKITDGTTKEFPDKRTGELVEREVWYFLPRSQIESDEELEEGKTMVIQIPEWLGAEKGLV